MPSTAALLRLGDDLLWAGGGVSAVAPHFLATQDGGWKNAGQAQLLFPVAGALPDGGGVAFGPSAPIGAGRLRNLSRGPDGGFSVRFVAGNHPVAPAVSWDSSRSRMLAFSGSFSSLTGVTSQLLASGDGEEWSSIGVDDAEGDGSPEARSFGAMAFDPSRESLLMRGGSLGSGASGDSWLLEGARTRPSVVVSMQLLALGLPADATPTAISIEATAGGDGTLDGGSRPGATFALWKQGAWWEPAGAGNSAPAAAPRRLSLVITDPITVRALTSSRIRLAISLLPVGGSAAADAALFVDWVEGRVDYLVP